MPLKVFVSYSTRDLSAVTGIRSVLSSPDIEVFVAEHSVKPGESLRARIQDAIESCDLFVLLWSGNASASEWVRHEVGLATGQGKMVVPVLLNKETPLPPFLADTKYLKAYDDPHTAFEWLRNSLYAEADKRKRQEGLLWLGLGGLLLAVMTSSRDEEEEKEVEADDAIEHELTAPPNANRGVRRRRSSTH